MTAFTEDTVRSDSLSPTVEHSSPAQGESGKGREGVSDGHRVTSFARGKAF